MKPEKSKLDPQELDRLAEKSTEAFQKVMVRSATDAEYRQKLLVDPRTAISEVTGQPLAAGYDVAFVENKADLTLVLPKVMHQVTDLNEAELEAVSGGTTLPCLSAAATAYFSLTYEVKKYLSNHLAPTPQIITDDDMNNTPDPGGDDYIPVSLY
jgi:hypothetical protein